MHTLFNTSKDVANKNLMLGFSKIKTITIDFYFLEMISELTRRFRKETH